MYAIGRFLMERSIFAVVPVLGVLAWNLHYVPAPQHQVDPWGRHAPGVTDRVAAALADVGEHFGIGSARAAGNGAAALAFRKARLADAYARHGYRKPAAAAELGMTPAQFQAALRRYGVIEWPEGHRQS